MSSTHGHILVAEDNAALASVLRFNLQRAGYRVTVACNGRVALDAVQEDTFDLIVTDEQMPEMTGCEFCEQLRTFDEYRHTPVILLTAKGMEMQLPQLQARHLAIESELLAALERWEVLGAR